MSGARVVSITVAQAREIGRILTIYTPRTKEGARMIEALQIALSNVKKIDAQYQDKK